MDLWKCAIVRNLFEKRTKHLALVFLKKKKRKKVLTIISYEWLVEFQVEQREGAFFETIIFLLFSLEQFNIWVSLCNAMNMNLQRHFVCRILKNVQLHLQKSFILISLEKILYRSVLLQADFEWCVAYWFGSTLKQCKHSVWHTSNRLFIYISWKITIKFCVKNLLGRHWSSSFRRSKL